MENDKSKWAPQRRHLMLAGALCISMMLPPTTAFAEITPHVSNSQAVAQTTRTVTGTVIDKTTGEAIIGATITVKGTNIKAVTDLDGKFSIKLTGKKQNVLEVSYIGFRTEEVDVEGQATIEIKIEPGDESLQEVVVVGAGTQKKIAMTGAITTIKGSDLRAPSSSLTTNLAGKFAGIIATTGSAAWVRSEDAPLRSSCSTMWRFRPATSTTFRLRPSRASPCSRTLRQRQSTVCAVPTA